MLTTCQRMRLGKPHWHGFSEVPCAGMRPVAYRCVDIAESVQQQTDNLWFAGSIPAIQTIL